MAEGEASGYRGYIASRPIGGAGIGGGAIGGAGIGGGGASHRVPQHVQNLVIRDYAARKGLDYRLSVAEYAMPGCYLMLEQVLDELPSLEGLIAYSLFMLPPEAVHRQRLWDRLRETGTAFHAAVEEQTAVDDGGIERLETLLRLHQALRHAWRPEPGT